MTGEENILKKAEEAGFENYRIIDTAQICFNREFRKYCEANDCGNYGNNYSCPPFCGSPEEMEAKVRKYKKALVLQTITSVKDIMDNDETKEIKHRHNEMTWKVIEDLESVFGDCLPAMAGPCGTCPSCAKREEKSCRYPEKIASCLSAYCIKVDALANTCEIPYYCEGKVAFFSLIFFDR